jgi:hypothetical protein
MCQMLPKVKRITARLRKEAQGSATRKTSKAKSKTKSK